MSDNYKSIFKGTLLFGGVQIFQILISFVRNKLNAIYLGPEGMGLIGLFNSSLSIIITIATMGVTASIVRYVANESDEDKKIKLIQSGKIVLLFQSLVGMLITLCLSVFLSKTTFNSNDYVIHYIILSVFVYVSIANNGNMSIIQGKQETKRIARANIISSLIGLVAAVPLLIFTGIKAVIPIMIITPAISMIYTDFSIKKIVNTNKQKVTKEYVVSIARLFLSYGFVITLSQLFGTIADYFINVFVSRNGGVSDIGFYNSGMSITYQCIGLVFNAMSIDYSPKVTAVCDDNKKMNDLINQQGVITLLLSIPILSGMMIFSPLMIKVFLAKSFLPITSFIQIIILGMFFKAVTFCLGSVSFAKGDKKIFFFYEGIYGTLQRFILSIIGYKFGGLEGLAWAFVINFFLYLCTVSFLCIKRYKFAPTKEFILISLLGGGTFFIIFLGTRLSNIFIFILEIVFFLIICVFSLYHLEKRIQILGYLKKRLKK